MQQEWSLGAGDADWIVTPNIAPDQRGPVERPFTAFADRDLEEPILARFERMAAARPDAPAVSAAGESFSFADLRSASARIADWIAEAGPSSSPIGLLLPIGASYPAAVFGALAAGRTTLLLDATASPERNAELAALAGVGIVLVEDAAPSPPWSGARPIVVRDAYRRSKVSHPLTSRLGLDDPAFILCTSGSTGRPKLIAHSQRTMLHWVRTLINSAHLTSEDRAVSLSSPAALGGMTSLLTFPLAGAAMEMVELKTAGLAGLLGVLRSGRTTILRGAPSFLRTLASIPEAAEAFAGLRLVQTYGEALMKADAASLAAKLPATCRIRTTYGSTEASGLSWFVGEPDDHDPHRVATGYLMPDTAALLLDAVERPCGPNEVGELVIRSRFNAIGEWREGRVVPGRLLSDPSDPGARIYRTGDLARVSPDGVFVVLGRKDRMVKINGQRVEPAEIEAALLLCPHVAQAAVIATLEKDRPRLLAFIVLDRDAPAQALSEARARLRRSLPAFMQPAEITALPALPRAPSGKIDEQALLAGRAQPNPSPGP